MNEGLVSIIVPVYNVQEYLPNCMDSILAQTYKEIEIILVDDGSTDDSGKKCDKYAKVDERVKVFHTENGGLSAARNVGLDNMKGKWCAFVDSDDWVEPEMIEGLIKEAISTDADFVQCGVIDEYATKSKKRPLVSARTVVVGDDILEENIIKLRIENYAWNKLYKAELFHDVRFLVGRNYEDIELTHRILDKCNRAVLIPYCYYHYRQRDGAISKTFKLKNLFDLWKSYHEKYEAYRGKSKQLDRALLEPCIHAAGTVWVWTMRSTKAERQMYKDEYAEIGAFFSNHYKEICAYRYSFNYRLKAFFTQYNRGWAFRIMDYIGRVNSFIKG